MAITIESIEAEALQLSSAERAWLVERLIASLDIDPEVEEAWAAEVERRNAEIESGAVMGSFPRRALAHVMEWRELHKGDLLEDWRLAGQRYPLKKIPPLE